VQRNVFSSKYINGVPAPNKYAQSSLSLYDKLLKNNTKGTSMVDFYKKPIKQIKKTPSYQMGPGDYSPKKKKLF